MTTEWTGEGILERMRGYQFACMVGAAAELDLYQALSEEPRTAETLAEKIQADGRGIRILADGLVVYDMQRRSRVQESVCRPRGEQMSV